MEENILEKTELEFRRLEYKLEICLEAVREYSIAHPMKTMRFRNNELETLLKRLFDAEMDYLEQNPEDYFEIYADDHEE